MTAYIELRVSKDGGYTWSDWKPREVGATGDFIKPLIWRRLGNARHFTFDFRSTGAPDILAGQILDANGEWIDAPVVGGAYADDNRPWSFQDTCNYIPVAGEKQGVRSMAKLRGVPGERLFATVGNGPIRAARDVEGKLFVVSGTGLYRVFPDTTSTLLGTIPGSGRCTLTHNQEGGGSKVVVSNGTIRGWTYDTITETFTEIEDEAFPGFLTVDYLDQYILGIEPQRRFAFHSDLADAREYSSIDRLESESSPDRLLAQAVNAGQWWLFGERTIDVYANTGAGTGTFQRIPGSTIDRGICGTHALAKLDNTIFFWGDDGTFYRLNGYTPLRVSTHPIEQAARLCDLSAVFCTVYEDAGHKIVWSTFPDGRTWGYDVASGEWFRRQSFGRQNWRMSALVKWRGVWLAGDSQDGKLYQVDWAIRDEAGSALVGRRTTGALHSSENRFSVNAVRLTLDTGKPAGLPTGPGDIIDPLVISGSLPESYLDTPIEPYSYHSAGGVRPHVFSISRGALPTGLTMDGDGEVTGTPTALGSYAWRVRVTDAQGFTAELDEGIDAGLGIEGPVVYSVTNFPPRLVTDQKHYTGAKNALAVAPVSMGWAAEIDLVRVSPDGIYAVGSDRDSTGSGRFEIRKYDTEAETWSALAAPAFMPTQGPRCMAWSPDGLTLAIGTATAGQYIVLYRRSGDTFTKMADPAQTIPNGPTFAMCWDSVGQRLAVGNQSSLDGVYVFDFVADALINRRNLDSPGTNFVGGAPNRLDFMPGLGSRYLAGGNTTWLYVIRCEEDPLELAASLNFAAAGGVFWDSSSGYLLGVSGTTVSVYEFQGSTIGTESLTKEADAPDALPGSVQDVSIDASRRYLAVATGQNYPSIYGWSAILPPEPDALTNPDSAGAAIASVSWAVDL
jgi:hypothetical protein